jgi:hypothetical protein
MLKRKQRPNPERVNPELAIVRKLQLTSCRWVVLIRRRSRILRILRASKSFAAQKSGVCIRMTDMLVYMPYGDAEREKSTLISWCFHILSQETGV